MKPLFAALLISLMQLPASGEADLGSRLDEWIRPLVDGRDLAGAVIVRHQGNDLIRRAYGLRNADTGAQNRTDTRFAIGSISKQFTAAATLRLRDQGLLDLGDLVGRHLPSLSGQPAVRIHDLLTHRSGLIRDVPADWESASLGALCARILSTPLLFEAGSQTVYSNAGYVVLACIVEAASGQRFEDFVRQSLFEPLGLAETTFWDGGSPLAGQAQGHDPDKPPAKVRPTPFDANRRHLGATGIVSTVEDLADWAECLTGGKVLSPGSTRELLNDAGDGRGFGVGIYQRAGHRVTGHDGVTNGYTAFLEWYPDDDLIVAYAGNIRTSAFEFLEDALPALVFGDAPEPISRPERLEVARDLSLVGSYRVHDQLTLDIAAIDGGLELRGSGGYFTPLFHAEDDVYWYPAMYAVVEPQRDEEGAVAGLAWRTVHGQSFEIPEEP